MGIYPNYLQVHASGELQRRAEEAVAGLASCRVCPRQCGVDRLHDERQSCDTGRRARVHGAVVHHGEETCISGARGSGTLFFSGCNLACVFCQNAEISPLWKVGDDSFAEIDRSPAQEEMEQARTQAREAGLHRFA